MSRAVAPFGALDEALMRYLQQPRDDDRDWDTAARELDSAIAAVLAHGNEPEKRMAAAALELKRRIDARRASLRGRN
jgi:hypothetical protein